MKQIRFRKAIELLGYKIIEYHRNYNYRTAFAENKKGELYYFSIGDLRDNSPMIYYRTAESTKDFTGGLNRFDFDYRLEQLGYKVFEPRAKCDYNSM